MYLLLNLMLTSHSWPGQVTIPFWGVVSGATCRQWVFKGLHTSRESFDNSFVTQQDVSTLSFLQPLALFLCSIFFIAKEHTVAPFLSQTAFYRQGFHSLLLFSYLSLPLQHTLACIMLQQATETFLTGNPSPNPSQPSGLSALYDVDLTFLK